MSYKTGQTTFPNGYKLSITFNEDKPCMAFLIDPTGLERDMLDADGISKINRVHVKACLQDANFVPLLERIPVSSEECDFELLKVGEL
jgi:hypothetical protein